MIHVIKSIAFCVNDTYNKQNDTERETKPERE